MFRFKKPLLIATSLTVFFAIVLSLKTSAAASGSFQQEPLQVVTKEIEPFVIKDPDRVTGFSIELWREIARIAELPYEFVEVESVTEQLDAVINGEADVAIAAISMTPEREANLDFSYPYYRSGLQILTTSGGGGSIGNLLSAFVNTRLLWVIGGLLLIMVIVGHLVWWTERDSNPDFPKSYVKGIWEGLWWSAVTMTTVGYGDKKVHGVWGRIIALVWMFSGLFLIANFTASVTAELTVANLETSLESVRDLRNHRVATVPGTTSAAFLRDRRIRFKSVETIEEAIDLLEEDEIDAVVYDAPIIQYQMAIRDNQDLEVTGPPFQNEDYGIALETNSPYEEAINQALLEMIQTGTYQELIEQWFGSTE
jgi:ABC-type amino acid transport substrate-binding protein